MTDYKECNRCSANCRHKGAIRLCICGKFVKVAQTNGDEIRAMTDAELAKFLTYTDFCETICGSEFVCGGGCEGVMLDWLTRVAL